MRDSPALVFSVIVIALFAILALFFLVRGLDRGPRSRCFANLALFCGLTAFVMPEIAFKLAEWERGPTFFWSGVLRVVLGLAGVGLGVVALATRRDGGTGIARPVIGIGLGLLHLAFAVGLIVVGSHVAPSTRPHPTLPQIGNTNHRKAISD